MMMPVSDNTDFATIWLGVKPGLAGRSHEIIQECMAQEGTPGLVSVTPTEFIGAGHGEAGFMVGCLRVPGQQTGGSEFRGKATRLAELLRAAFEQRSLTIVFSDQSYLLTGAETNADS